VPKGQRPLGAVLALLAWGLPALLSAQAGAAAPAASPVPLTVAAAANLAPLGAELAKAWQAARPGGRVDFVFGASGGLVTQIKNGAPFQLFLSADTDFPAQLAKAGLSDGPPAVYARGVLVLLSATPRNFSRGLSLLAASDVKQFAIANPETAPYGRAAKEALAKAGLWDQLQPKAVFAQNIGQALQYTQTATGIGFVNKSALFAKDLAAVLPQEGKLWAAVNPADYAPLDQAYAVVKPAKPDPAVQAEAQAFAAFLASPAAQAVFKAYGYEIPKP
jgi:molybdate transport system substrate-binding protein